MKKTIDFIASDNVTAVCACFSIIWGVTFLYSWATKPRAERPTETERR